jgi:hypothetical protein
LVQKAGKLAGFPEARLRRHPPPTNFRIGSKSSEWW